MHTDHYQAVSPTDSEILSRDAYDARTSNHVDGPSTQDSSTSSSEDDKYKEETSRARTFPATPQSLGGSNSATPDPTVQFDQPAVSWIGEGQFARYLVESKIRFSPAPDLMFPWLHGIAPDNTSAMRCFEEIGHPLKKFPVNINAGLLVVACGNFGPEELEIRGVVNASELLKRSPDGNGYTDEFLPVDEHHDINIRNFKAQAVKYAECCDIIVYLPTVENESRDARERRLNESLQVARYLRIAQNRSGSHCNTFFYPGYAQDVFNSLTSFERELVMLYPPSRSGARQSRLLTLPLTEVTPTTHLHGASAPQECAESSHPIRTESAPEVANNIPPRQGSVRFQCDREHSKTEQLPNCTAEFEGREKIRDSFDTVKVEQDQASHQLASEQNSGRSATDVEGNQTGSQFQALPVAARAPQSSAAPQSGTAPHNAQHRDSSQRVDERPNPPQPAVQERRPSSGPDQSRPQTGTPTSSRSARLRAQKLAKKNEKVWDVEFLWVEKQYLNEMTAAVEVLPNIWLGNSLDALCLTGDVTWRQSPFKEYQPSFRKGIGGANMASQSLLIDCGVPSNIFPSLEALGEAIRAVKCDFQYEQTQLSRSKFQFSATAPHVHRMSPEEEARFVNTCYLIYLRSQRTPVLIHSMDGHYSTSFLILGYLIYRVAFPLDHCLLFLHKTKQRAFSLDVKELAALSNLQELLISLSPTNPALTLPPYIFTIDYIRACGNHSLSFRHPAWLDDFNGKFPSRLLPHLYVGSHHQSLNKEMLLALGIRRIISIGECPFFCDDPAHFTEDNIHVGLNRKRNRRGAVWCCEGRTRNVPKTRIPRRNHLKTRFAGLSPFPADDEARLDDSVNATDRRLPIMPRFEFLQVDFEDDGTSALSDILGSCLDFIRESEITGIPTFVHCQQGVSRSVAICIAAMMKSKKWVLPQAYMVARVRRLDFVIQPNLRLMYELMKFEESTCNSRAMEWPLLCRGIARLNDVNRQHS